MPTRRCCCGTAEFCFGCCFPLNEGVPQQLTYELSAPNCLELDGATGILIPQFETNDEGDCGNCLCYITDADSIGSILGGQYQEIDEMTCFLTPCQRSLNIYLMCDRQRVIVDDGNPATDPCCQDMKLLVAFDSEGTTGTAPPREGNICRDFIAEDGVILENVFELEPVSCECEDDETEFILIYDLSYLMFLCTSVWDGGPCDELPKCCVPGACDFTAATLTITGP